jgi:hypothetical protein
MHFCLQFDSALVHISNLDCDFPLRYPNVNFPQQNETFILYNPEKREIGNQYNILC